MCLIRWQLLIQVYSTYKCKNLKQVRLPSSLEEIRFQAFYECENLKQVQLPSSLEEIAEEAFCECKSLEPIDIPDSVIVHDSAFHNCANMTKQEQPKPNDFSLLGPEIVHDSTFHIVPATPVNLYEGQIEVVHAKPVNSIGIKPEIVYNNGPNLSHLNEISETKDNVPQTKKTVDSPKKCVDIEDVEVVDNDDDNTLEIKSNNLPRPPRSPVEAPLNDNNNENVHGEKTKDESVDSHCCNCCTIQ